MTPRISLALAIHNHQPVGNFGWVIAEVFEQAYQPMVEALERHPAVRLVAPLHGPAARLAARRATRVHRAPAAPSSTATRSRSSGGGYYEPVLASLPGARPDRPARADGRRARGASFGRRPRGAWLAERVWEPDLPTSLVDGGYDWTILDDAHFRAAAIPEDDLWGPYTTEDQGQLADASSGPSRACATGSRSGRRGGHRLPPRPRDRGRRRGSG